MQRTSVLLISIAFGVATLFAGLIGLTQRSNRFHAEARVVVAPVSTGNPADAVGQLGEGVVTSTFAQAFTGNNVVRPALQAAGFSADDIGRVKITSQVVAGTAEGKDHGQSHFCFAKIVAHGFSHHRLASRVIECVIDQLECNAEVVSIIAHRRGSRRVRPCRISTGFGCGGKKGRCLGGNDTQILALGNGEIFGQPQLQHFAFRDHGRRIGEDGEHDRGADFHHQLKRPAEQEIAHQNAGFVSPQHIGGGTAAAKRAFVDNVVVKQGRGMDEFDSRGELHVSISGTLELPRRNQRDQGSEPLAAGIHKMLRKLRNQGRFAQHA